MTRNESIREAVELVLAAVDQFISSGTPTLPHSDGLNSATSQLQNKGGSVRVASLFLAYYSTVEPAWDCESIPMGIRGEHGDKLLSSELSKRDITLHKNITAFGENLGWKGNVSSVALSKDSKFKSFVAMLALATPMQRKRVADYMAAQFADSRRVTPALPAVGSDVLTFARAKQLFQTLLELRTEGHVQQFLIAALLWIHRRRFGHEIRTHHAHAADKFDNTAGDIEEFRDGRLLHAYEVTVRPDWKNRLPDFKQKMDSFKLKKYVIIASAVNEDEELAQPARLITFLKDQGRDIAVVDIQDVANVMATELSATELREAVNKAYEFIVDPKLCGRDDIATEYKNAVGEWLSAQTSNSGE